MGIRLSDLPSFVGKHVLPYTNPRVVCPPGEPQVFDRPNIVVATPKRCGTHVLIDTILNNMPAYRNRPLYIDLDKSWKRRDLDQKQFHRIAPNAGYVLKTHVPIEVSGAPVAPQFVSLLDAAVVLTVQRDPVAMVRSMARWMQAPAEDVADAVLADRTAFETFWMGRPQIALAFEDLFLPERMQSVLAEVGMKTGAEPVARYVPPPKADRMGKIMVHKTLTRVLGKHAPRIDTTIHTLK